MNLQNLSSGVDNERLLNGNNFCILLGNCNVTIACMPFVDFWCWLCKLVLLYQVLCYSVIVAGTYQSLHWIAYWFVDRSEDHNTTMEVAKECCCIPLFNGGGGDYRYSKQGRGDNSKPKIYNCLMQRVKFYASKRSVYVSMCSMPYPLYYIHTYTCGDVWSRWRPVSPLIVPMRTLAVLSLYVGRRTINP